MAAPTNNETERERSTIFKENSTNFKHSSNGLGSDNLNALMFGAVSCSVLLGFGVSLYSARRKDPLFFKKMIPDEMTPDTGPGLASKALAVATVVSVSSVSLMLFGIFKLFGVHNFHEFHAKMREYFPKKESKGRVHFKNLRDLADYLTSEARKEDLAKEKAKKDQS